MFPEIAGQERGLPERKRVDPVLRVGDLELVLIEDEPSPAAAELPNRSLLERLLEFGDAAEIALDRLGYVALRRAAAIGLHAVPEEGMVPDLRGVVEHGDLRIVLVGRFDQLFQ